MIANAVCTRLERAGIRYALIGAAAVALRGYPRFTQDTDLLTMDRRVLEPSMWEELRQQGVRIDIRRGEADDPLQGVIRIGEPPEQVDLVIGRWVWETRAIERAEPMEVFGTSVPVASRSDLILLKLAAGGYKDLADAAALLSLSPREKTLAEVESSIGDLPGEAKDEWARLMKSLR